MKEPPERRSDREQAAVELKKLIEMVQMTLFGKSVLFNAIDIFLRDSNDANWQNVLAADSNVQNAIRSGIEAAVKYDAKWGGLLGVPVQIRDDFASALNPPFPSGLPSQLGALVPRPCGRI